MPNPERSSIVQCPDYVPANIYDIPHSASAEALPAEISSLYEQFALKTKSILEGGAQLDPDELSTTISDQQLDSFCRAPTLADIHAGFTITIPTVQPDVPGTLLVGIKRVDPDTHRHLQSYRYRIDQAGRGISELTVVPFGVALGGVYPRPTTVVDKRPL